MKLIQLASLIALTSAVKIQWDSTMKDSEYKPYTTADYVKKNDADVIKTTFGAMARDSESK